MNKWNPPEHVCALLREIQTLNTAGGPRIGGGKISTALREQFGIEVSPDTVRRGMRANPLQQTQGNSPPPRLQKLVYRDTPPPLSWRVDALLADVGALSPVNNFVQCFKRELARQKLMEARALLVELE